MLDISLIKLVDECSKGFILADYGPVWKEHRRFALMTLKNFGMGKESMEERILQELTYVISKLEACVGMACLLIELLHELLLLSV